MKLSLPPSSPSGECEETRVSRTAVPDTSPLRGTPDREVLLLREEAEVWVGVSVGVVKFCLVGVVVVGGSCDTVLLRRIVDTQQTFGARNRGMHTHTHTHRHTYTHTPVLVRVSDQDQF